MNGLNGSVAVLTTTTSSSTITTSIAETETSTVTPPCATDPDATNNSINKPSTNNDMKTTKFGAITQVITELANEDRFTEHEEYSTGKKKFMSTDVAN